jgi:hypothetical protein
MEANQPNLYPKTIAAINMVNAGIDPTTALQNVNLTKQISKTAVHNFNKKYQRYLLSNPKIVKLAHQVVENTLKGTTRQVEQQTVNKAGEIVNYTEQIAPSFTNQLEAAKMVYDRIDPIQREQEQKGNADILSLVVLAIAGKVEGETQKVIEMPVDTVENT